MGNDQNWYRQLLALVLLSSSKAAVEFLTNPSSRQEATKQLRQAFAEIDYNSLANAMTQAINNTAATSKETVDSTIDTLRNRSVKAVDDAKHKAQKQLGKKQGGKKMRLFFGLVLGALIGYFLLDEQRRNELLDRLTGASGPIQQTAQNVAQQATSTAQQATHTAENMAQSNQPPTSPSS